MHTHYYYINSLLEKHLQDMRLREQELSIRFEQECDRRRECATKLDQAQRQLDDARDQLQSTEARASKLKTRVDEERGTVTREYEVVLDAKKDKIAKQKALIGDLETALAAKAKEIEGL